jgi:phosphonate transport system substrate-binding protein
MAVLLLLIALGVQARPPLPEGPSHPAAAQAGQGVPETIRFGITPVLAPELQRAYYGPILEYLSRQTGRRFEMVIPETYEQLARMAIRKEVDFAYLAPGSYIALRSQRPEVRPLLSDVRGGVDFYMAYILVRADSGISSPEDLRGRSMAFVDVESASGYVAAMRYLADHNLDPNRDLKRVVFTYDHLKSMRLLAEREVDAIATFTGVFSVARSQGIDVGNLRILAKTARIPWDCICLTSDLPEAFVDEVVRLLLKLNTLSDEGRRLLPRPLRLNGWRRGDPRDYDGLERLMTRRDEGTP